jgi:hypothetical protein
MSNLDDVKQQLASNADVSAEYLVKILGVTKAYAYTLLSKGRKELGMRKNPDGKWRHKTRLQGAAQVMEWQPPAMIPMPDPVNHPAHYKAGGIETIDFIEAKSLNYRLGNVVKYITRADHKGNRKEDLEKARWYLDREIASLK